MSLARLMTVRHLAAWPERTATIVCDMWDEHRWRSAAERVAEMAPRLSEVVSELRVHGSLIIHAPSSCMEYYVGTPARSRAIRAPHLAPPVEIDWNDADPSRHCASVNDSTRVQRNG